jgi:hypothetical protein
VSEEHDLALASVRQSLDNEQAQVRREEQEARERRYAEIERREQEERDEEEREKEKWREIKRQQQIALNEPSTSTAAMWISALDKVNADLQVQNAEASRNLQRQIEQARRDSEQKKRTQQQAYQDQQHQLQLRREQQQREHAQRQQLLAQQRQALLVQQTTQARQQQTTQVAQQETAQAQAKEKYQLVVEALAFCWESSTKKDHWRCRGPSHIRSSKNNATSLFEPDLLKQASNAGCSDASDNYKQAWSSGDKSGYVMHCQKPLNESDADVASDYGMPAYIRVKRKVYKCNYPIQNGCTVYMQGNGDVANRRVRQ